MEDALTQKTVHFADVNWHAPWIGGLRAIGERLAHAADWRAELNEQVQGLCNHRGMPLRFVPQERLPEGCAYEAFISDTGCVPTRDNLHDFFNAQIWLAYPQIKQRLNAMQARELAVQQGSVRGRTRDAATLFDENAALFVCSDRAMIGALRDHRWHDLFVARHAAFGTTCQVFLFGHALLEKLNRPYKAITAHAWVLEVADDFFAMADNAQRQVLDQCLAASLEQGLSVTDFTPLPVLGVPQWALQQDSEFYADQAVFRPKRTNDKKNGSAMP